MRGMNEPDEPVLLVRRVRPDAPLPRFAHPDDSGMDVCACEDRVLLPDADTLMIVPMLAYDAAGYRLGAGGGYYDRYLAKYKIKTLGICYAECRQTQLPHDEYDQKLQSCVTEQKTEEF